MPAENHAAPIEAPEPGSEFPLLLLDGNGVVVGATRTAPGALNCAADEIRGLPLDQLFELPDGIVPVLETAKREGRFRGWCALRRAGPQGPQALLLVEPLQADPERAGFAASILTLGSPEDGAVTVAQNEQQFRMLVQGVTDYAIYMLDPSGRITNWNAGGERIKGYSASEIIGQHFSHFYTPEDRERGDPGRTLSTAATEGRFEGEGWRVRKDGTRFWASVVVDRILDADGRLLGFAKVTRDLTERKKAEEALEETRAALAQSQKMEAIGQLTGGVAHDFNNLLTVISNALDLVGGPIKDELQRRRIIDSAQRAAQRGAKLTQQLLAFARRQPLRPEALNLNVLIAEFEAVLRRACREAVRLEFKPFPRPVAAYIDGAQFETALLNLVLNARDAMPNGGRLTIKTSIADITAAESRTMSGIAPGSYVVVKVADTGEGMSPEVLAHVFEPFFTTKQVGYGSGLGLSQVYGFVAQSGGHVALDSTPGKGTTVTLYLPSVDAELAGAYDGQGDQAAPRILVVEDDPEVLDVTVETLRCLGYEVLTAPEGPSALAVLHRDPNIDVLFTDIVMPRGMNGIELAREARRLRPELRILLASGYPKPALPEPEALDEFSFLSKPYRSAELAEKLREVGDQRQPA